MTTVEDRIRRNIEQAHILAVGDRLLVAVSGGPDSLCLLHVLCRLQDRLGLALHVAHLDHGLRGSESAADAQFVCETCRQWGIAATVETADVAGYRRQEHLSLEDAARRLRYAFLARAAISAGARVIAAGHTADDQVETIVMHWLRGAGAQGLRGMAPLQTLPDGMFLLRPMLDITRAETEAYCREQGLAARRDRSNDDGRYYRNRVRNVILPLLEQANPNLRAGVLRNAAVLAAEDDYLRAQTRRLWEERATVERGRVTVELAQWPHTALALQRRLVREAWQAAVGAYSDLESVHVEAALHVLAGPPGGQVALPGKLILRRGYETFAILPQTTQRDDDSPLLTVGRLPLVVPGLTPLPATDWVVEARLEAATFDITERPEGLCEFFDADRVGETALRRRRPGDRMQPLGLGGTKKVQDVMAEARIERALRSQTPLLVSGEDVLWVVGARRAELGRVTSATRRVLRVTFQRGSRAGGTTRGHNST